MLKINGKQISISEFEEKYQISVPRVGGRLMLDLGFDYDKPYGMIISGDLIKAKTN
jgi:hypothetical protein